MSESEARLQAIAAEVDRRAADRSRTYKAGKIISVNLSLSFDCVVRDLTATGARLIVPDTVGVPTEFFFLLPSDRLIAKARVVWRKRGQIGIQYMEPMVHPQKHSHPGLRLVALC